MRTLSAWALGCLGVLVLALYLPLLYGLIFFERVEKTHLLFSPVTRRFVYTEKAVGEVPPEAAAKAEDHHAGILYRDQNGAYYGRQEFERLLPFIYYRNMELWGLLPLEMEGRTFGAADIRAERQVMELRPQDLPGKSPDPGLWPLLESNPDRALLSLPEDCIRLGPDALEFVNADTNAVDPARTREYTEALVNAGFVFPARGLAGRFTVLKPFDEGVFLVDRNYAVFHLKRVNDQPRVVRTPIDPGLRTRHLLVLESQRREYYGLLLDGRGRISLLGCDGYRLTPLDLPGFDPERMEFKLLLDPLFRTAVYSDQATVRAVALDRDFREAGRMEHRMSRAEPTWASRAEGALFPFRLAFTGLPEDGGGYLGLAWAWGSAWCLPGLGLCLAAYLGACRARGRRPRPDHALLAGACGVYGLAVTLLMLED